MSELLNADAPTGSPPASPPRGRPRLQLKKRDPAAAAGEEARRILKRKGEESRRNLKKKKGKTNEVTEDRVRTPTLRQNPYDHRRVQQVDDSTMEKTPLPRPPSP